MLHSICKRKCVANAKWYDDGLYCSKCGKPIAFRYTFNGEVRFLVYQAFKKYTSEIKKHEDCRKVSKKEDVIRLVDFFKFDEGFGRAEQAAEESFLTVEGEDFN